MEAGAGDRVGVLVLRIWIETLANGPSLVARITVTDDLREPETTSTVAGSVDEALGIVRSFLERFVEGAV